jgi:hypothetical protein
MGLKIDPPTSPHPSNRHLKSSWVGSKVRPLPVLTLLHLFLIEIGTSNPLGVGLKIDHPSSSPGLDSDWHLKIGSGWV